METDKNEIITQEPLEDNSDPVQADPNPVQNVVSVEELLPSLRSSGDETAVRLEDSLPGLVSERVATDVQELLGDEPDRNLMTTELNDYTVTEGLLLIIVLIMFLNFFLSLIRRWF